ncbi:hypothetical protein [Pseudosulfitobacter pseudonitzschiae]|uniref:hypothetical protein n=1 Tax=Pseudosulfitobacter pseudonitzschiae TaxID=1402135 RepID=UPI003B766E16
MISEITQSDEPRDTDQDLPDLCDTEFARNFLKIYRDTPAGMIPCDGGEFVRLEDAARYFEWQTINRVLALLQTFDERDISRKLLYRTLMEMRPIGHRPKSGQEH